MRRMVVLLALAAAACATAPQPVQQATSSYSVSVAGFVVQKAPYYSSNRIETSLYLEAVRDALAEAFGLGSPASDGLITVYVFENADAQPPRIEYKLDLANGRRIKGQKYGGDRRTPEDARRTAQDLTREIERRLR
jgi:hypothetical protein